MEREGWYRRVVPVTVLAAGVVAALALAVPGVRHQVALSASHQPQEYVALAFGRAPDGTVLTCQGDRKDVRVSFDVASHLADARDVRYVVSVAGHEHPGSVAVEPGETVTTTATFDRPERDGFTVRVTLPDEDREVFAHCGAAS
jgi:hypothetical protein